MRPDHNAAACFAQFRATLLSTERLTRLPHRRILVADDEMDTTLSLATLLRLEGHEVTWACDGYSALQEFKDFQPDVAILDLGMPNVDGLELAREIRGRSPAAPVLLIAVSGWARESDVKRSRLAGFNHHLVKPVEFRFIANLL